MFFQKIFELANRCSHNTTEEIIFYNNIQTSSKIITNSKKKKKKRSRTVCVLCKNTWKFVSQIVSIECCQIKFCEVFLRGEAPKQLKCFPLFKKPHTLSMLLAEGSWSNSWQSGSLLGQNEMGI